MDAYESVSTWRQDLPPSISPDRRELIDALAVRIIAISPARLRVVVDGYTASGKTSFGHELAAAIRAQGRPTLRASLDDFKKPWRDAAEKGYDRTSGDGYYRNAPDFESTRNLLLEPAGPLGSGTVALCGHDPLTGVDHLKRLAMRYSSSTLCSRCDPSTTSTGILRRVLGSPDLARGAPGGFARSRDWP